MPLPSASSSLLLTTCSAILQVRKSYEEKRKRRKARGEQRSWKVRRLAAQREEEDAMGKGGRRQQQQGAGEDDMERFLQVTSCDSRVGQDCWAGVLLCLRQTISSTDRHDSTVSVSFWYNCFACVEMGAAALTVVHLKILFHSPGQIYLIFFWHHYDTALDIGCQAWASITGANFAILQFM